MASGFLLWCWAHVPSCLPKCHHCKVPWPCKCSGRQLPRFRSQSWATDQVHALTCLKNCHTILQRTWWTCSEATGDRMMPLQDIARNWKTIGSGHGWFNCFAISSSSLKCPGSSACSLNIPRFPAKRLPSRKFQRDAGLNAEQTPFQLPKPSFDLFNQLQRSKVL